MAVMPCRDNTNAEQYIYPNVGVRSGFLPARFNGQWVCYACGHLVFTKKVIWLCVRTLFVTWPKSPVCMSCIIFIINVSVRSFSRSHRFSSMIRSASKRTMLPFRLSKNVVSILLIILLVVGLTLVGRFFLYQIQELRSLSFSSVYQEDLPFAMRSVNYNSDDVFTLLLFSEKTVNDKAVAQGFVLIRLDMISHKADMVTLHPDLSVPLSYIPGLPANSLNLTSSKVKDLSVIGELQIDPIPFTYVFYQLQELYAVAIDGYVVIPEDQTDAIGKFSGMDSPEEAIRGEKSYEVWSEKWLAYWIEYMRSLSITKIWMNRDLVQSIGSNMGVVDVYSFIHDFSSLPDDSVSVHIFDKDEVMQTIDERGELINVVTVSSVDELLAEVGQDDRMDREQARIEIFNGTDVSGWGSRYERWIKHLGGDVIRVKNAPQQGEGTTIYVTDLEKYSYTVERISSLWEDVKIEEGRPGFITTGDIVIVLGVDF